MSSHPSAHDSHGAHGGQQWVTGGAHTAGHPHVTSSAAFFRVLVILLVLTAITVGTSRINFGAANMLIAMCIACIKASLVIAIFMHVWWDTAINKIMFLGSFLFLSLLFAFTLSDLATRGWDNHCEKVKAPVDKQWVHPAKLESAKKS